MFKLAARSIFALTRAGVILAWMMLAAFWLRSHWRLDMISFGMTHSITPPPQAPRLFQGLRAMFFSGDGGMGVALQRIQQYHEPPAVTPGLLWQSSAQPKYPDPWMTTGLWVPRQNFFISGLRPIVWDEENSRIFVGTIAENRTYYAFIHQMRVGISSPTRVKVGDRIANGRVTSISFDQITYQRDGAATPTHVPLYYDLTGGRTVSISTQPAVQIVMQNGAQLPALLPAPPSMFETTEFGTGIDREWKTGDITQVFIVPYWSAMALLSVVAILPTLWLLRVVRQWRWALHGRCAACGYDLRATPARCPECGTVVDSTVSRGTS